MEERKDYVEFKLGGNKQTKELLEASFANTVEEDEILSHISIRREDSKEDDIFQIWKQKQETELSRIEKAV